MPQIGSLFGSPTRRSANRGVTLHLPSCGGARVADRSAMCCCATTSRPGSPRPASPSGWASIARRFIGGSAPGPRARWGRGGGPRAAPTAHPPPPAPAPGDPDALGPSPPPSVAFSIGASVAFSIGVDTEQPSCAGASRGQNEFDRAAGRQAVPGWTSNGGAVRWRDRYRRHKLGQGCDNDPVRILSGLPAGGDI
jgi:hypothetical protein